MIIPCTRTVCLYAGMSVSGWALTAPASEDLDSWRLFDPEPVATSPSHQLQEKAKSAREAKSNTSKQPPKRAFLIFNGVVFPTLLSDRQSGPAVSVWLNGYPVDTTSLPAGVSEIKWHADRQILEVKLSDGSRVSLSPGDSIMQWPQS